MPSTWYYAFVTLYLFCVGSVAFLLVVLSTGHLLLYPPWLLKSALFIFLHWEPIFLAFWGKWLPQCRFYFLP